MSAINAATSLRIDSAALESTAESEFRPDRSPPSEDTASLRLLRLARLSPHVHDDLRDGASLLIVEAAV